MVKFDPFAHENLFYEYILKITNEEVNQILMMVKNLDAYGSKEISECKTTFTTFNILNFPILKNLKKQITNILDKHKLFLDNNWAQLYNTDHGHSIHFHESSIYSGIIYIKGNNPSPTIFYSKKFNPYDHKFKANTLLLFPSMIPHEVKTLKKDEERLIISFNAGKVC